MKSKSSSLTTVQPTVRRLLLEDDPALYDILLKNSRNLGKGGAVKRGLEVASGDYILFQDADLEYDPNDYADLLAPVLRFDADVVLGSRFAAPKWTRVFYFWHKLGNLVITTWFNLLYNTTWTDVYSCYLMFRRDLIKAGELRRMGWDQHAEILGKSLPEGRKILRSPDKLQRTVLRGGKEDPVA